MNKAITFLGTTDYKEANYVYKQTPVTARFFGLALPKFFPEIEEVILFVTPTVAKHDNLILFEHFFHRQHPNVNFRSQPIPEGHEEQQLWDIFKALTDVTKEGDNLVFDITNSFRSFPFLVFLATAYLHRVKNVEVSHIVYGAFEATNKETKQTPVFELTPFVSLLDWLAATNQFIYTGDARYLASQLEKEDNPELNPLANAVRAISTGLDLLRPFDVSQATGDLSNLLKQAQPILPEPFELLANKLETEYSQFACEPDDIKASLQRQLAMINWYYHANRYVHTLASSREWLISLLGWHFGVDIKSVDERTEIEILLSGGKQGDRVSKHIDNWASVKNGDELRKLWSPLANLRNDVLHVGFRKNPRSVDDINEQVKQVVDKINAIAHQWDLA